VTALLLLLLQLLQLLLIAHVVLLLLPTCTAQLQLSTTTQRFTDRNKHDVNSCCTAAYVLCAAVVLRPYFEAYSARSTHAASTAGLCHITTSC
jgi:hypothetical protein